MNKINVFGIIKKHLNTFRDEKGSILFQDTFVFIILPILLGLALAYCRLSFNEKVYGHTITVFAIFAALLLSVQVALFSIYIRPWKEPDDSTQKKVFNEQMALRKKLLGHLNCNIAYLILGSCFFVTLILLFFVLSINPVIETGILAAFYLHFLMNLLMVIKRAFILFHKEYEID